MWITRLTPARKAHLRGLLRVSAYFGALTVGVVALRIRAARAEFQDRSMDVGRQIAHLAQATQNDVNKLSINGQAMWVGSSLTDKPVKNILDGYEAYCKDNGAHPAEDWRALAKKADTKVTPSAIFSTGILRGGGDAEGAVMCFTKGDRTKASFTEAIKSFHATGELGALGALRYAYARQTEKGNTLVLTAWTDDRFNVGKLIPEEGKDAAGFDFPEVPRAPESERVFSTQVEGTPFGLNVYRSPLAPSKVASFYDEKMRANGWGVFDVPMDETTPDGTPVLGRLYERDGVVLSLASHLEEGASFTALGIAGVGPTDR